MKIISGNFENLKSEMKLHLENVKRKIKIYESERKRKKYLNEYEQKKLQELYNLKRIYTPTNVLPVKINGTNLVIDFKIYQSFMKKIQPFTFQIITSSNRLCIEYQTDTHSKGCLELYDLSSFFSNFQNIPVGGIDRKERL
ncbi:hypothetical protein B0I26_10369 [Anoxybacillus vitaminiphilus]|uniref:Uncharacterized protein n=1 Tax=Paranoxybacillus vitaminiphilus TaxID=581036 RepID=A0A327YLA9_9BACL|nr:hypothetical protein [Anoxybacillus vitaminiphilus]RAK21117.1 hypothetical protein B0I26_10369 [Anoxybacillus vitaminiphilus]